MELSDAAQSFGALAQETRLGILKTLVRAGPQGLAASDIAVKLLVPAPTLSFHLKDLAAAGLITPRRSGRYVYYAADYGGVRMLIDFLMSDCCQGDPRLCGPYVVCAPEKEACA